MSTYDYLIVGSGLFGAVFAHEASMRGKKCLVLEKREHVGGNVYCEEIEGILVHRYGAHIFHTSNSKIWEYVSQFCEMNRFTNMPVANFKGEIYNMPFNMNTFSKLWGVVTPQQAKAKIEEQRGVSQEEPRNLEEQAIRLVGEDIYHKLIQGYTEKQWGKPCSELPAFIIKRLPVRYTYDNNYFNDRFQGIPIGGYNVLIDGLLKDIPVKCGVDYLAEREIYRPMADKVVYTGQLDAYFDYAYGPLEYRSLRFETECLDMDNYQGVAVMNYTDRETPYTRIIEHKHFDFGTQEKTVITREYPVKWEKGMEAYYPVNDDANQKIFAQYQKLAEKEKGVLFGGRLASYKYYDMDKVIEAALEAVSKEFEGE